MSASFMLLVPVLVLCVVILFAFAGCTGDDPVLAAEEAKKEEAAKNEQQKAADLEASKYDHEVLAETGLVSFWRLDDVLPGDWTAKDSAPDVPLDGEYKNVLGVSRGEKGALILSKYPNNRAVDFDGGQGYVEAPYNALLNPPLDFSLECWVKPEGTVTKPQVVVGAYEIDGLGKPVRGFVLEVILGPTAELRARASVGTGSSAAQVEASLGDGTEHDGWRHLAVTYAGAAKELKLYVNADDGKPDAQAVIPIAYADNKVSPFRIAAGQTMPGPVGAFYKGRMDEVALYRIALPGTAISSHFIAAITP